MLVEAKKVAFLAVNAARKPLRESEIREQQDLTTWIYFLLPGSEMIRVVVDEGQLSRRSGLTLNYSLMQVLCNTKHDSVAQSHFCHSKAACAEWAWEVIRS
jgi:hypothetical protein